MLLYQFDTVKCYTNFNRLQILKCIHIQTARYKIRVMFRCLYHVAVFCAKPSKLHFRHFTHQDNVKCCLHLPHAEAVDSEDALCSNLGFLQSQNIFMIKLFIHGQGPRLTTHLHLVLMLRLIGAVVPIPPICLHAMYNYIFAFALCSPVCA